jgi:cysteine desulfurase
MLYLDYAASAPIRSSALKILETSQRENFANPSSAHKLGKELSRRIEGCRLQFLEFLGAGSGDRLIFTSSATESNNTVIKGLGLKKGDSVLVSFADHPSVVEPVARLEAAGVTHRELPLYEDGTVKEEVLPELLEDSVKLVILTHVNNQSGAIEDIGKLSRQVKKSLPAAHIHVDAAQGFGKIPFSLKEMNIDSLSISSHKLGGPKGIAGLYLRRGITISPLLDGGGQEGGLRSSTQAAPLVFSFFEAAREALETLTQSRAHVSEINRFTRECLQEKIPAVSFPFRENGSPYILTFLLPGISSDIILRHLEQREIMISSTAACSSKIKGANPVFTALHLPKNLHKFVLRVSFSHETTQPEVETFCRTLALIFDDLKRFMK